MKDAFMVKLDPRSAQWVRKQAVVFGSCSAVIRTAVRVVLGLIASGSLVWNFPNLQRILLGNPCNAAHSNGKSVYAWKGIAASRAEAISFMEMISRLALRPGGTELRGAIK